MQSSDNPLVSNQISDPDFPDNFPEFIELFDREYKKLVDVVNTKEGGLYIPQEVATFQRYYTSVDPQATRNVYRKLIDFGVLPNATTKRVPHNIDFTNTTTLTHLYGAATDPSSGSYIPLPFSSPTLADNISLEADEAEIIITTGANYSTYANVNVVIEYLKEQ